MDFQTFKNSLSDTAPPQNVSELLQAMWYDGKGDWHNSHEIAQDVPSRDGDWVHAYLHRKEGDQWNAEYWYRRAGRPVPHYSLDKEWEELVKYFINNE